MPTPTTTSRIEELRHRVMGMESEDCRQELADTLNELDKLDADFATLAREVAALRYNDVSKTYETSKRFDHMMAIRGIDFPFE